MRKYLYFSTAVAGVMIAAWGAMAQCMMEQDCVSLGYTQTSCPDGAGIKCPFGSGWYCGGTAAQDCIKLGYDKDCTGAEESGSGETCNGKYQSCTCDSPYTWSGSACTCPSNYTYTCSGTGYSGGSGTACGGKYAACTCASGYEWNGSSCQQQVLNGAQGKLYYCNGTVVGVRATGMNFYVAMKNLGNMTWHIANSQCDSYVFCGNVKGTLPTKAQLKTLYNNKSGVNTLLSTNGGTQLTEDWYWSSTYYSSRFSIVDMSNGNVDNGIGNHYVRPVLTSW